MVQQNWYSQWYSQIGTAGVVAIAYLCLSSSNSKRERSSPVQRHHEPELDRVPEEVVVHLRLRQPHEVPDVLAPPGHAAARAGLSDQNNLQRTKTVPTSTTVEGSQNTAKMMAQSHLPSIQPTNFVEATDLILCFGFLLITVSQSFRSSFQDL